MKNGIIDTDGRGCVRTLPSRVGPFPDLGGIYGYCPACKEPQGDRSHAWIHECSDKCEVKLTRGKLPEEDLFWKLCPLKGRAIFMCQREMLAGELLNELVKS